MSEVPRIFDRRLRRLRRQSRRALDADDNVLRRLIEDRLLDRLDDVKRLFSRVLVLGAQDGALVRTLLERKGVDHVTVLDEIACDPPERTSFVLGDEELLPFAADSFDLVLSAMSLQWIDDLPGLLVQVRRCLTADGLLLAATPGGSTLQELRAALLDAELALRGGVAPRVSPFLDVRDAGMLLQRAGLNLPVADTDKITVQYADPLALMRDLRAMGEAAAFMDRPPFPLSRTVLAQAVGLYGERHTNEEGRVEATFEIVTLTGWKPHESQPQALRRGSGSHDLAQALGVPFQAVKGTAAGSKG